jgi:hypothetical protein
MQFIAKAISVSTGTNFDAFVGNAEPSVVEVAFATVGYHEPECVGEFEDIVG